jgi:tRNA(fMet)-specific endonuclease VapC
MYLLDTDICSYLMKRTHPMLIERVRAFRPGELKVSVVTQYELEYGVRRSDRMDELGLVVAAFLGNVEVLPFEVPAARQAAQIRSNLATSGAMIGSYDLLIAGQALSLDATLVTNNTQELGRVAGLRLENWTTKE